MKFKNTAHGMLVPNVKEIIPFYRDILGYEIIDEADGFVLFDAEGARLFMWELPHITKYLGVERMAKVKHKTQFAIRFDTPSEVDDAYKELSGQGVDFVIAPQDWPDWKAHAGYFVDPNGYMWEIFCWINNDQK
ncbi:MAG: VOC family protein [Anaerolineaceae bacterium]|nr:VOC family protein [Anaerolineaceae bacterium]